MLAPPWKLDGLRKLKITHWVEFNLRDTLDWLGLPSDGA
jgi:hypothetical protein